MTRTRYEGVKWVLLHFLLTLFVPSFVSLVLSAAVARHFSFANCFHYLLFFFFFFWIQPIGALGDSFTSKVKIHTCNKRLIKRQIATLQQLYRVICIAFHFVWICIQQHWRRLSVPVHCLDLPRPEHKATAKHWSGLADLTRATAHSQLGTA